MNKKDKKTRAKSIKAYSSYSF